MSIIKSINYKHTSECTVRRHPSLPYQQVTYKELQLQPRRNLDRLSDSRRVALLELVRHPVHFRLRCCLPLRALGCILGHDRASEEVHGNLNRRVITAIQNRYNANAVSAPCLPSTGDIRQKPHTFSAGLSSWRGFLATGCASSAEALSFELRARKQATIPQSNGETLQG